MRAIIIDHAGVRLEPNLPMPRLAPGEALIRIRMCSTDPRDLKLQPGGVPGHEFVGVVQEVTDSGDRHLVGKRVVGHPVISCGHCELCSAGMSAHCRSRSILGSKVRDGSCAEFCALPVHNLSLVPDTLPDEQALFACVVASALHTLQQVQIAGRPNVSIIGDDPLSLVMAQLMTRHNATVRLLSSTGDCGDLAEKWGIKHRVFSTVGLRHDQDVVVDCLGTTDALRLAIGMLRPRAKLVLKCTQYVGPGLEPSLMADVVANEYVIIGSWLGTPAEAVTVLNRREVEVSGLIGTRVGLADAAADFVRKTVRTDSRKVIVEV